MKKVTIIINNLGAGGAERYVVDSVNEMLCRGIDVHLITLKPEKGNSLASECNLDESKRTTLRFKSIYNFKNLKLLIKILREQKPDAVFTHLWFANTIGRLAAYFAGVAKIFSMEHSMHFSKSWKQRYVDVCFQIFSDRIFAVSETVKKSLIEGGIQEKKVSVVYVALNTKRFGLSVPMLTRTDFGIPENEFVFLYVGRLNPPKNVSNIIRAFNHLDKGVLCIAGSGESERELKDLTESLGNKKIFFLGFVKDIPSLMAATDCFVFVPLWEALGLVAVEALLSGLPVITRTDSAMSEFVEDGYNGLLARDPKNVSEMAELMRKMVDDKNLFEQLKKNTKNLKIDFRVEHNVDAVLEFLN